MRLARFTFWVLFTVFAAHASVAQTTPPAPEPESPDGEIQEYEIPADEIIVERERIVDLAAASDLSRAISGRARSRDPLARFNASLCLTLAIDDPERGRLVGRRIIANARTAGVRIAKPGCRPNALVIIADDMRGRIEEHRRSGRRFFGTLKRHEIDRVLRSRDPAYVFQDVEVIISSPRGRVDRNTVKNTRAAAVMIDNGAAAGFTPEQVADYASLRLLAPARELDEVASGAPRTILTLFRPDGNAPAEMSRFDRAYLSALYSLMQNATAMEVIRTATRNLAEPPERAPEGGP